MPNSIIADMLATDKDKLKRVCRRLLSEKFIVKSKDNKSREDYLFCRRNSEILNDCFEFLGYYVSIDKLPGVVSLESKEDDNIYTNKIILNKSQSMFFFILYQFFIKKRQELNNIVLMNDEELNAELEILQISMNKKDILDACRILKKYNIIIKNSDKEIYEKGGEITIFSSILLTIDEIKAANKYEEIKEGILLDIKTEDSDYDMEDDCNEEYDDE